MSYELCLWKVFLIKTLSMKLWLWNFSYDTLSIISLWKLYLRNSVHELCVLQNFVYEIPRPWSDCLKKKLFPFLTIISWLNLGYISYVCETKQNQRNMKFCHSFSYLISYASACSFYLISRFYEENITPKMHQKYKSVFFVPKNEVFSPKYGILLRKSKACRGEIKF